MRIARSHSFFLCNPDPGPALANEKHEEAELVIHGAAHVYLQRQARHTSSSSCCTAVVREGQVMLPSEIWLVAKIGQRRSRAMDDRVR